MYLRVFYMYFTPHVFCNLSFNILTIFIQHILIITIAKRVFKAYKKALANFSESNKGFNAYKGDKGAKLGMRFLKMLKQKLMTF